MIGGGAAGMMAAIQAAGGGAQVTVYEKNDRVGKKILSTGNGKCNFSNEVMHAGCYYGSGSARIEALYQRFGVAETKIFFRKLGMRIKDRNGYLYPASEQAATVLDVLRYETERLGIRVCTGCSVTGIRRKEESAAKRVLTVTVKDRGEERYDAVILACGGRAAPKTGSDGSGFEIARKLGHRIVPVVPALTALRCEENFFKQVAGVRCDARMTLYIDERAAGSVRGELQLTDYGISGIPVFQFSRTAAYALREHRHTAVGIDFMPEDEDNMCDGRSGSSVDPYRGSGGEAADRQFWDERWKRQRNQKMEQFVTGIVNKKIGLLLLKLAGIRETERAGEISLSGRRKLEKLFRSFVVTVRETNAFEQAQVCAGGVDFDEVTENLESIKIPDVFFAGELLDIDGICGGYNLQWAWSSGAVAGRAAARDVHTERRTE